MTNVENVRQAKDITKKTLVIDGKQLHFIILRYQPDIDDELDE